MFFSMRTGPRTRIVVQYLVVGFSYLFIRSMLEQDCNTATELAQEEVDIDLSVILNVDSGYISPNEILRKTVIGVKSFSRDDCLGQFRANLHQFAPYLRTFVADGDESGTPSIVLSGEDKDDVHVNLPEDGSVSAGRNGLLLALYRAGYEYLILTDVDYRIQSRETIPRLAERMVRTGADLVATTRCDTTLDDCRHGKGMMVMDDDRNLVMLPNVTLYDDNDDDDDDERESWGSSPRCFRSDLVHRFFIVRTGALLDDNIHWDRHLASYDHHEFLLAASHASLRMVTCTDIRVSYQPSCSRSVVAAAGEEIKYLHDRWGINKLYNDVGETSFINDHGEVTSHVAKVIHYETDSDDTKYLINSVADALNGYDVGSSQIRPVFTQTTWVTRREYSPCVHLVAGNMNYYYEPSNNNVLYSTRFEQILFNETCSFAEKLWQHVQNDVTDVNSHIYYVTIVVKRNQKLKQLLHNLDADPNKNKVTLIIVTMDSTSDVYIQQLVNAVEMDVVVVDIGPPYSRSIGMAAGFRKAVELAGIEGHTNAIGFSVDAAMVVPSDLSTRIRHHVQCGSLGFAPVAFHCSSCTGENPTDLTSGYWMYSNFDMVGMCLTDYVQIGGYNPLESDKTDIQQLDLLDRMIKHLSVIYRAQDKELYSAANTHTETPDGATNTKLSHTMALPSIMREVRNSALHRRLLAFTEQYLPSRADVKWQIEKVSRGCGVDASSSYYYIIVSNSKDDSELRWILIRSHLSPVLPDT